MFSFDVLSAELLKARSGRPLLVLVLTALGLVVISDAGLAAQGAEHLAHGATDAATLSHDLLRNPFSMMLFGSLFGALSVTREYGNGAIGRSALVCPDRSALLAAKAVAATVVGASFGLLAVVTAVAGTSGLLAAHGVHAVYDREGVLILVGVFVVNLLAGAWGVFVGVVLRHQVVAAIVLVALDLLVEPAVTALAPSAGRYLFTTALGSIYRDGKPYLLSVPLGSLVVAAWLAAAALAARQLLRTRDLG